MPQFIVTLSPSQISRQSELLKEKLRPWLGVDEAVVIRWKYTNGQVLGTYSFNMEDKSEGLNNYMEPLYRLFYYRLVLEVSP